MIKKRKQNHLKNENLVYAVKTITPVVDIIREANTNEELSSSEYFNLVNRACEYDQYAELFASGINIEGVRYLLKENFTAEERLAMLYLIFNSSVKTRTRKKIACELEREFPEEIEAIKKHGITNSGLESIIK